MSYLNKTFLALTVPVLLLGLALAPACSGDGDDGGDTGGSGNSTGGSLPGVGGADGLGGSGVGGSDVPAGGYGGTAADPNDPIFDPNTGMALCGTDRHVCQCSNGMDDDGDGDADGADIECAGALDDDEGSFGTGISGDNRDPFWQDCFFDGNSGAGDDKCRYHTECITGERPQTDRGCQLSEECQMFCGALAPNGCDCFGCCTITTATGDKNVIIGSGCSTATLDDETLCKPCVKSTQCGNECGHCELCPGKTELPEDCMMTPTCEGGEQVCNDTTPCAAGYYCSLGCCLPIPR